MAQPRIKIKRYALVPDGRKNGAPSFHLARVASGPQGGLLAGRLERMEEIAELDRLREDAGESGDAPPH